LFEQFDQIVTELHFAGTLRFDTEKVRNHFSGFNSILASNRYVLFHFNENMGVPMDQHVPLEMAAEGLQAGQCCREIGLVRAGASTELHTSVRILAIEAADAAFRLQRVELMETVLSYLHQSHLLASLAGPLASVNSLILQHKDCFRKSNRGWPWDGSRFFIGTTIRAEALTALFDVRHNSTALWREGNSQGEDGRNVYTRLSAPGKSSIGLYYMGRTQSWQVCAQHCLKDASCQAFSWLDSTSKYAGWVHTCYAHRDSSWSPFEHMYKPTWNTLGGVTGNRRITNTSPAVRYSQTSTGEVCALITEVSSEQVWLPYLRAAPHRKAAARIGAVFLKIDERKTFRKKGDHKIEKEQRLLLTLHASAPSNLIHIIKLKHVDFQEEKTCNGCTQESSEPYSS
jgi:hypothetical protein